MARKLRVKVDVATSYLRKKFRKLGDDSKDEFQLALRESAQKVRDYAKKHHRFKTHTGKLEKSVKFRVRKDRGDWGGVGEVYLDNTIAPYAKFVHEGTKTISVVPRNKLALRFYWENMGCYFIGKSVNRAGIGKSPFEYTSENLMPDDFLYRANDIYMRAQVNLIFANHLKRATKKQKRGR